MNDLERGLVKMMVKELERLPTVTDDAKREMREKLLAMELLERVPKSSTPPVWTLPQFWGLLMLVVGVVASLLGAQIDLGKLTGGK